MSAFQGAGGGEEVTTLAIKTNRKNVRNVALIQVCPRKPTCLRNIEKRAEFPVFSFA